MSSLGLTAQTSGCSFINSFVLSSPVFDRFSIQPSREHAGLFGGYFFQNSSREWQIGFWSAMDFGTTSFDSSWFKSFSEMTVKSELANLEIKQFRICNQERDMMLRVISSTYDIYLINNPKMFNGVTDNLAAKPYIPLKKIT